MTGTTPTGPMIGMSTGVYRLDGTEIPAPPGVVSSVLMKDGTLIWGSTGSVYIGNKALHFGADGPNGLAELNPQKLIILKDRRIFEIDPVTEKEIHSQTLDFDAGSLAKTGDGGLLVGTAEGALRLTAELHPQATFSTGLTRVKDLSGHAVIICADGSLLDEKGDLLMRVPRASIIDCIEWQQKIWALVKCEDQTRWLGVCDPASKSWIPYDVPLANTATAMMVNKDRLVLVGSRQMLEISRCEPLSLPPMNPQIGDVSAIPLPRSSNLAENSDAITLLLGAPRFSPWNSPSYSVSVRGEAWEEPVPFAELPLTRLRWGRSTVDVRRTDGVVEDKQTVIVNREWPLWAKWPACIVYTSSLGGLVFLVSTVRTVRLQKRALMLESLVDERTAQLKKAQRAREDFFSTMSHEIRNPLNGVVGICDILGKIDTGDVRRVQRHVLTLIGCAGQLRTILDDVLDFARIDRGEFQLYDESFDLTAAVEGAAQSVDPSLQKTTLKLPTGEVWVRGDSGKVRQIITNLVSNALKYGQPSAARVSVDLLPKGNRLGVAVTVANTGTTLAPEDLQHLFTEFARGQDAVRRKIMGTGLGLVVSKRMAEAMKGSLHARSGDGLTEFILELEFPVTETPVKEETIAIAPSLRSRALAIEDEEYNRIVLGFHLQELGYEVDWANDGATALEYVRESAYDLILTDFLLPDITGDQLARQLLEIIPAPKPIILAVTAFSTPEKIAEAKAAGVTGFITKPVSMKKIRDAILGATSESPIPPRVADSPHQKFNLTVFDRSKESRRTLAEYADAVLADWENIEKICGSPGAVKITKILHEFRSRVLIVHARELADQVMIMEGLVVDAGAEPKDLQRLLSIVRPMVFELVKAAKEKALS